MSWLEECEITYTQTAKPWNWKAMMADIRGDNRFYLDTYDDGERKPAGWCVLGLVVVGWRFGVVAGVFYLFILMRGGGKRGMSCFFFFLCEVVLYCMVGTCLLKTKHPTLAYANLT